MQHEEECRHCRNRFQRAEEQVGAHQQPPVEQPFAAQPRRAAHGAWVGFFRAERQRGQHVGAEIDREDLDDGQRQRDPEQHEGKVRHQLGDVGGEDVGEELAQVVEHRAPFLDGDDDGGEVVVEQDDVGRFLGDIGAGDAHRDADVGALQRRRVVHPVAGHRDDLALALQGLHDAHLLVGAGAREQQLGLVEQQLQIRFRHAGAACRR